MKTVVVKRILRHKSPVLIFPYYINTRESEIIKDVISGYNPELITELDCTNAVDTMIHVNELKNYI